MKIKVEQLKNALLGIESDRQLSQDIIEDALKEALTKAYRKHIEISDAYVRVEIKKGEIRIIPQRIVVEDVEDDELEISLEDARKVDPSAQIDDLIDGQEVDFTEFDRVDVSLAKNVIKQKIREAEKQLVYEEYCDKVDDMILGEVLTVEEKFVIVDIGKTAAMMKKSDQISTEQYFEGQKIKVIIKEVNKETKGAQVLVSRSTPVFVRRLFEREVPEVYDGTIEIKAMARDAGERCKIAVYSHNENVDPIGACIGPRGQRVQEIIKELNGEKMDIFEWSDNIGDLIKNALSPSEALAVFPNEEVKNGLIVVVPDNQLSLAIGKKGKNARLAVKLTNRKIDIKAESEMIENGIDYLGLSAAMQEEYEAEKAKERAFKQQEKAEALRQQESDIENVDVADFTYDDEVEEDATHEDTLFASEQEQVVEEPVVAEPVQEEKEEDEMEKAARLAKEMRKNKSVSDVKEYTSKFENFADASNKTEVVTPSKPKVEPKQEEKEEPEEVKVKFEQFKPIYSEEELAEIEAEQEEEEERRWDDDVDYEEYDEYYE